MIKSILSGLSFLFALFLGWGALHLLVTCIFPWRKAPDTTHTAWIFAGAQFTGWQLLVPFTIFAIATVIMTLLSLWMLKTRS